MYQPQQHTGGMPWGDAFIVNTPAIDQVNQQMYQEQLRRQMYAQQQSKTLDSVIDREAFKIRSADAPAYQDLYQDYKGLAQRLLFDKNLQNNPKEYQQVQMDKSAALSQIFKLANKSALGKQQDELLYSKYNSPQGHNAFVDNFGEMYQKRLATPIDDLEKDATLGNIDNYYDKGVQNFNFGTMDKAARGTLQPNGYEKVTPVGTEGLQEDRNTYKSFAPPTVYKQNLLNSLATGKGGKWASAYLHSIDPAEIERTHQAFMNLTPQDWLERTGKNTPQDVSATNPKNDADALTSYLAEKNFVNSQPVMQPTRRLTDAGAKMQAQDKMKMNDFYKQQYQRHIDKIAEQNNSSANTEKRQQNMQAQADVSADEFWKDMNKNGQITQERDQYFNNFPIPEPLKKDFSIKNEKTGHLEPVLSIRKNLNTGEVTLITPSGESDPQDEKAVKALMAKKMFGAAAAKKVYSSSNVPHGTSAPTGNSGIKWQ